MYAKALSAVGNILVDYDTDKLIPVIYIKYISIDVWIWRHSSL